MIRNGNKLTFENTPNLDIDSYIEHFLNSDAEFEIKKSTSPTTDFQTINWDTIVGVPLASFTPDSSATWYQVVSNAPMTGNGLSILEGSPLPVPPGGITIELTDNFDGGVHYLSDYFLPLGDYNVTSITIDQSADVAWEVREAESDTEDWTEFTNGWTDAAVLAAIQGATGDRGLHLWFYGTRTITIEIDGISKIDYFNFINNPKFSTSTDNLQHTFDGIMQYGEVQNTSLDPNKEYYIVACIDYLGLNPNPSYLPINTISGAISVGPFPTNPSCFFAITAVNRVQIGWRQKPTANTLLSNLRNSSRSIKLGRNIIIAKLANGGSPEIWINGAKDPPQSVSTLSFVVPDPGAKNDILYGINADANLGTTNSVNYGGVKTFQIIDATNVTISDEEAYRITCQGSADGMFTPADFFVDLDTTGPSLIDKTGKTVVFNGGFTQNQFMD